ncbi:MAG: hypothetical protein A3J37_00585 [Alphaproteobacteria bacterium RIFCSPHIGHO2_12_FULL_45_9]|nr:MAG: hypothetical protein A3B66_04430 [Alphaproteobacteria bacterium RIFCSPHIGHO2_02_FULL_46_13]OFW93707.1 MAG: hypothetical protein A3J37_00585 [Alphaproteobacteria bacterium RIFCSPHIGHO2_12_FULL_45_9]
MKKFLKEWKNLLIFFGMIALVVGLWIGSFYWIKDHVEGATNAGVFGDQFGAVNALFSGLAFAGLIYTILLQREELQAQREELGYTRDEIKGQKLELKAQNETLALQRFENSFFSMLSLHQNMIEKFVIQPGSFGIPNGAVGKDVLSRCESKFTKSVSNNSGLKDSNIFVRGNVINDEYSKIDSGLRNFIKVYFRSLHGILLSLKKHNFTNQSLYADIIKSQFTDSEVLLISLYGLTNEGEYIKSMIEDFQLLEFFQNAKGNLYHDICSLYTSKAFA